MNRKIVNLFCGAALLANNIVIFAQNPVQEPKKEARTIVVDQDVIIKNDGAEPNVTFYRNQTAPAIAAASLAQAGGQSFGFVSSEINIDNRVVKGKPYTAEIVKENIQSLGDGNRIVRKTTASVARDSEGRTRQEQIQIAFGPLAEAMANMPKLVTINDPVAGTTYTLNAQEKIAMKMPTIKIMTRSASGASESKTGNTGGRIEIGGQRSTLGSFQGAAIKKVQPSYPASAKAAGAQGTVEVTISVNEAGDVVSAEAISGHPLLRESAVEAAKQWKFKEVNVSGKPVKTNGTLTFNYTLAESRKTDSEPTTLKMRTAAPGHFEFNGQDVAFAYSNKKYESKKDDLGTQTIEGVVCTGTRETTTIPAGDIGNELPINIVSESWYSNDLETVVLKKFADPRYGEDIYRLININRSEPARELFEVPADYTVKEGGMMHTFNYLVPGAAGEKMRLELKQVEEKIKKDQ